MKIYTLILTLLLAGCWKEVQQPNKRDEFEEYRKARPKFSKEFYECKRDVIVRYSLMGEQLALKYEDALMSCDYFIK